MIIHFVVNKILEDDILSSYAKFIADEHEFTSVRNSKLIASMNDKNKYIIHEMNLKEAVDAGLIMT